jgi:hypothetical protein
LLWSSCSLSFDSRRVSNSDLRRFWTAANIDGAVFSDYYLFCKLLIFSSSFVFSALCSDLRLRIRSLMFLADSWPYSSCSCSFYSSVFSYYSLSLACKPAIIYGAAIVDFDWPSKAFFYLSSASLILT